MMQVYTIFSFISISIACLGLLGLASFMVNRRTKEIGIRKIVGASFVSIAAMLSLDYFKWIISAIVIGSMLSWYLMKQWLQNFAYATALSWWVFVIAGACLILIAFFTVSWHLYNAARRNPVETLRYE
jgi:putative ABC transport system permease protein